MTHSSFRLLAAFSLPLSLSLSAQNCQTFPNHSLWVFDWRFWETSIKDFVKKRLMMRLKFCPPINGVCGLRSKARFLVQIADKCEVS